MPVAAVLQSNKCRKFVPATAMVICATEQVDEICACCKDHLFAFLNGCLLHTFFYKDVYREIFYLPVPYIHISVTGTCFINDGR